MSWRSFLAILVSAVAALVVISGVLRLGGIGSAAHVVAAANPTVRANAVAAQARPQPPAAAITAPPVLAPAAPDWRALAAQLQQAPSLRAFYYTALRAPANGGYYYATRVLAACATPPQLNASTPPQRQHALTELQQRCDFSAIEIADAQRELKAMRDLNFADDPLLAVHLDFLRARDPQGRAAALTRALQSAPPELLASLVTQALTRDAYLASAAPARAVPDYLDYGSEMLACALGADCGQHSALALALCAHDGLCGSSVEDALRQRLGADFAMLARVTQRTVADVRAGKLAHLI